MEVFDVLVAGGGNAAMCAALSAREAGASVVVAECAPQHMRAGNSRHARNFRCMHTAPTSVLTDAYTEEEYFDDLLKVTAGHTDEELARLAIRSSPECFAWMIQHGVRFQPSLAGTLHLGRTNAFFLGGGKALVNTYYAIAEKIGIRVLYNAEVTALRMNGQRFESATVQVDGAPVEIRAKAFVAASGGLKPTSIG
jgi:tricarballylate dehydrogenase